jgi:hypothetical protein
MNYNKLYSKFIESRPLRKKQKNDGLETHHILPKSLGGKDTDKNKIVLTFKEHWLAHRILVKMYSGKKKASLVYALFRMANHHNSYKITGKKYEYAKNLRLQLVQSKNIKKKLSEEAKARWQDPTYRKNRAIGMAKAMSDPIKRKKMSMMARKKFKNNPALKENLSTIARQDSLRRWANPEYKEKVRQSMLKRWAKIRQV